MPTNEFILPEDKYPYEGLPESYRDQLLSFVMPAVQANVQNAQAPINRFEQQAAAAYTPIDPTGTYTPVNMGQFTPVNTQGAYTPVNQQGVYTPVDTGGFQSIAPGGYTGVDLEGMGQNIDTGTQAALSTYRQQLQNYLKEMIPEDIRNLANRGVLSSTVAENMLSDTAAKGARDASTKGYETLIAAEMQKAEAARQAEMQRSNLMSQFAQQAAMATGTQRNELEQQAAMANAAYQNQFAQQAALQDAANRNQFMQQAALQDAQQRNENQRQAALVNAANRNQFGQQAALQNAAAQTQLGYNTALQAANMRSQIPTNLEGLLKYGMSQQDPSVMYRTMADLLASL